MVGGAHGQVGHHAHLLVVEVEELDNACVTTLIPREVEVIVLVITARNKLVALQIVQVCETTEVFEFGKGCILISWTFTFLKCCSITVDGGWGSWSSWSSCSATCGGGQRTRQRLCSNPLPSGGGNDCTGLNSEQQTCNTADCPGKTSEEFDFNKACTLDLLEFYIFKMLLYYSGWWVGLMVELVIMFNNLW